MISEALEIPNPFQRDTIIVAEGAPLYPGGKVPLAEPEWNNKSRNVFCFVIELCTLNFNTQEFDFML